MQSRKLKKMQRFFFFLTSRNSQTTTTTTGHCWTITHTRETTDTWDDLLKYPNGSHSI